jgi:N,N'-diacetyllegionaminate synthase
MGIEVPIAAVALGACVIEKHFTLDRNMEGPDHKASMEPSELKDMVRAIRNIEVALGDGEKKPTKSEIANIKVVRRGIVALEDIKIGSKLTSLNVGLRRIDGGRSPLEWDDVIGSLAKKDYRCGEII